MTARSYIIGAPLAVTVSDDGSVEFDLDLSEVGSYDMEPINGDLAPEQFTADVATVDGAAARLGGYLTTTINPPTT